jgi:CRP-like cAMP-binding protein
MQTGFAFSRLADRLASITELSGQDLELLAKMPSTIVHYCSHDNILQRGDRPANCSLLLQGYLCWRDGDWREEQITSIHVPGDIPDLHTIHDCEPESTLSALGPAVVAFVPHAFFHEISARSPAISHALSLLMVTDAAAMRNWIVNLGSRDALTRVAHLLCEIAYRLRAVGQAKDYQFPSPFTQSDLAAACGISAVHANRTIQDLRRNGLLQWQSKTITITNWNALVDIAGFRPNYLRLREANRPALRAPALPTKPPTLPMAHLPS